MIKKLVEKYKRRNTGEVEHYELWTSSGEEVRDGKSSYWDYYPRPQMRREKYLILKDGWMLNHEPIRMPFPPQSMLSGYKKEVGTQLIYEVPFAVPRDWEYLCRNRQVVSKSISLCDGNKKKSFDMKNNNYISKNRVLLHFGAVDQIAEMYVNGSFVGKHEGGYLPFSFDVTDYLDERNTNQLTVKVTDELDKDYPYGKQTKKRGGMWYTPVSGIWQNVWLELVPETYIKKLVLTPDLEGVEVSLDCDCTSFTAIVDLGNGKTFTKQFEGANGRIQLAGEGADDGSDIDPKLWSPETPNLYNMKILAYFNNSEANVSYRNNCNDQCASCEGTLKSIENVEKSKYIDSVETYFALRTITIEKRNGISRVCLNGKPIFLHGVLDQGYYSDGLYLPAKEEEFEQDILRMKNLGYNMLRKHIKVEPEYFYYACDKLGMLVMQDMVNNGPYSFLFDTALPTVGFKRRKDTGIGLDGRRQKIFIEHTKDTIEHLYNHPSIVAYTIFNEGWGQFQSDTMYELVKSLDTTRLVDSTSGWFAQSKNDFDSEHIYFKVIHLDVKDRPLFLSECGGYSLQIDGHYYNKKKQYGYGACTSKEELTDKVEYMYREMVLSSAAQGICGCVYTQLSDVEDEINGLYTYDRKVCKVLSDRMQILAKELQDAVE